MFVRHSLLNACSISGCHHRGRREYCRDKGFEIKKFIELTRHKRNTNSVAIGFTADNDPVWIACSSVASRTRAESEPFEACENGVADIVSAGELINDHIVGSSEAYAVPDNLFPKG